MADEKKPSPSHTPEGKHAYYAAHKEQYRAYYRKYREANKEKETARNKEYNEKNRDAVLKRKHAYYEENKVSLLAKGKIRCRKNYENNKPKYQKWGVEYYQKTKGKHKTPEGRFIDYTRSAKQRGIVFVLTVEEFMSYWRKPCSYCGDTIETIGLDRLDSNIGYTTSNVVPCCHNCNIGKRKMSPGEYIDHCRKVVLMAQGEGVAING
jgi:hypothetical protein